MHVTRLRSRSSYLHCSCTFIPTRAQNVCGELISDYEHQFLASTRDYCSRSRHDSDSEVLSCDPSPLAHRLCLQQLRLCRAAVRFFNVLLIFTLLVLSYVLFPMQTQMQTQMHTHPYFYRHIWTYVFERDCVWRVCVCVRVCVGFRQYQCFCREHTSSRSR